MKRVGKRVGKEILSIMVAVVLITAVFSGCGTKSGAGNDVAATGTATVGTTSDTTAAESKSTTADFIKLKWYVRFDDQKDMQLVNDEINKTIREKINAEVEIARIDLASYNDRMKLIISSGENYDICFTGASYADFFGNVSRGAFLPLDELLSQYASKSYSQVPVDFWNTVKIKGEIYGFINYQIVGRSAGFGVLKSFIDKYKVDMDSLNKLEDLEPLLTQIKAGETKDIIPFASCMDAGYFYETYNMGIDEIGTKYSPGVVIIGDESLKVVNQYEQKSVQDRIRLMRKWYEAGYINKDAATLKNTSELSKAGKTPVVYGNIKPGGKAEVEAMMGDRDVVLKQLGKGFVSSGSISTTLQAISKNSGNPQRAMMFLELMNTDKQLYNTMCFGIEGKHYKKIGENRVELIPNSGYYPNKAWAFGNQFNAYVYGTQPDDVWEQTIALNENAERSLLLGFVFDQNPVKTEMAQCASVLNEYLHGLYTGSIDPGRYIPEFLNKLKTAGSDRIIEEKQKQIDEWKKNTK